MPSRIAEAWARPGIDHLVVAARDLDEGAAWVSDLLGVPTEPGGEHPAFGTHNRLLSLGPTDYLEILAVNPRAEATGTAYPLGLGLPEVRERLTSGPILLTWVVRVAELAGAGVRELSRGAVRWRALPREDGSLPCGGALPAPIQWLTAPPWTQLPDRGIRLRELVLNAPNPHQLQTHVQAVVGAPLDCRITLRQGPIGEPALAAALETPTGPATL